MKLVKICECEKVNSFTDKSILETETIGNIHSFESMGSVDGPGVRSVIFMQGCNLRCAYCHNPDTWSTSPNKVVSSKDMIDKILKFKPYYISSGGGVTFSGGEPLLQPEFLLDMLKKCKYYDIHTAIDTSGVGHCGAAEYRPKYRDILTYTDLILLDIKHVDPAIYKNITCREMDIFNEFLEMVKEQGVKVWIRAVIVPGINDNFEYIKQLFTFTKSIPGVEKYEILPYHTLGVNKYNELGVKYRLDGLPPMDKKLTSKWEQFLNDNLKLLKTYVKKVE